MGGWVGGWVGWVQEEEAVRMGYWNKWVGGWVGDLPVGSSTGRSSDSSQRERKKSAGLAYWGQWKPRVGGWVGGWLSKMNDLSLF